MIYLLVAFFSIITLLLHVLAKHSYGLTWTPDWWTFGQLAGLLGTVTMSFSFVLSSRFRWLDKLLGGQDKIIKAHQILGATSFGWLVLHPLLFAVYTLPNFSLATNYLFFSDYIGYNLGVSALYLMILAMIFTLVIKMPYHHWLKTHHWLGGVLFLSMAHIFFVGSDVSRYLPLKIWMWSFMLIGIFCFVYKVWFFRWFGPVYKYVVTSIRQKNRIFEIELSATSTKIPFVSGQFAFVSFQQPGLTELHPFSITSHNREPRLKFSIKTVGDYTKNIANLAPGTSALVWGAYGSLGQSMQGRSELIMIAGGIGITPFLSLIRQYSVSPTNRRLSLFYCVTRPSELIYDPDIRRYQKIIPYLKYFPWPSSQNKRLTATRVLDLVSPGSQSRFCLCGPKSMMYSLGKQLIMAGVSSDKIFFEDFDFKILNRN